jgi:hypothetical protein
MNDNLSFQKYRISITTTITTLSVSVFASDQQPMAVTLHTMIVYCLALPHRCGDHRTYMLVSCHQRNRSVPASKYGLAASHTTNLTAAASGSR